MEALASIEAGDGGRPAFEWLGRRSYEAVWRQLTEHANRVATGCADEIVWSCEHNPVYTTGRRGIDNRLVAQLKAPFVQTDRGGETTFHGPGQIMFYPVIHLRRRKLGVRKYIHALEQSCIGLLEQIGINACRRYGLPGIWVGDAKIAAIGIRVAHGVAYHGMALNIDIDSGWFSAVRPCGTNYPIVDVHTLAGAVPGSDVLAEQWYGQFCRVLPESFGKL